MAVKLHRCPNMWAKFGGHPCWRVQRELDAAGIDYEVVKGPLRRGKRIETIEKTGQNAYPWFEFEDGSVLREPSSELATRIRTGHLFDGHGDAPTAAAPG